MQPTGGWKILPLPRRVQVDSCLWGRPTSLGSLGELCWACAQACCYAVSLGPTLWGVLRWVGKWGHLLPAAKLWEDHLLESARSFILKNILVKSKNFTFACPQVILIFCTYFWCNFWQEDQSCCSLIMPVFPKEMGFLSHMSKGTHTFLLELKFTFFGLITGEVYAPSSPILLFCKSPTMSVLASYHKRSKFKTNNSIREPWADSHV